MDYELWLDENGLKDTPAAKQAYAADLRLEAAIELGAEFGNDPRGVAGLMIGLWLCKYCGWICTPNPDLPLDEAECDNCGAELEEV